MAFASTGTADMIEHPIDACRRRRLHGAHRRARSRRHPELGLNDRRDGHSALRTTPRHRLDVRRSGLRHRSSPTLWLTS